MGNTCSGSSSSSGGGTTSTSRRSPHLQKCEGDAACGGSPPLTADSVTSMSSGHAQQQQPQPQQRQHKQAFPRLLGGCKKGAAAAGSKAALSSQAPASRGDLGAELRAAHMELRGSAHGPSLQDSYAMGHVLGCGRYARCHVAVRRSDGQRVAVKVVQKEKQAGRLAARKQLQHIEDEVAVMRLLGGHPNAVQLHQVYQDETAYYLVMELCTGGDLLDHVYAAGALPEADAACITRQLASFLAYAHSKHVMHRDIKPENMLLAVPVSPGTPPAIKIVDFGGAALCAPGTRLHKTFGSIYYVAPEVMLHDYDLSADAWSAGVVLHLLLTDTLPFDSDSPRETLALVLAGEPDWEPELWDPVSKEAQDLVRALLNVKPAERPTAAALLAHPWVQQQPAAAEAPASPRAQHTA